MTTTGFECYSALNIRGFAGTPDTADGWLASHAAIAAALSMPRAITDDQRGVKPAAFKADTKGVYRPDQWDAYKLTAWMLAGVWSEKPFDPSALTIIDVEDAALTTWGAVDEPVLDSTGKKQAGRYKPTDADRLAARRSEKARIALLKKLAPNSLFAFYNHLPGPIYWPAVKGEAVDDFFAGNTAMKSYLSGYCGACTGGHLYTLKPPTKAEPLGEGWVAVADIAIEEARRIAGHKPVIALVRPDYVPYGNNNPGGFLPPGMLTGQLEWLKARAQPKAPIWAVVWSGPEYWANIPHGWFDELKAWNRARLLA